MLHKPTYIEEIEKQIDSWNSEMQKFRIIAEVADKDDQIRQYKVIEDIADKEKQVVEKLEEIRETTEVHWEHMATELEAVRVKVENAIEEARVKIN